MAKKDGKELEKIVALIERSIDPEAVVEHDVQMPILNSPSGATTQCDIVIRKGTPQRQTVTIIEVQDRNSKVKPNDFRGWIQKLSQVGAQHLICVSKKEFPDSIREQAMLHGNSIHLVNLSSDPERIPLNFFNSKFTFNNFEVYSFTIEMGYKQKELENANKMDLLKKKVNITSNEESFSFDKVNRTSLFRLCRDLGFNSISKEEIKGELEIDIKHNPPLYYHHENDVFHVGLKIKYNYTLEEIDIPINLMSYNQSGDTLAWLMESFYESPRGIISFKIPVQPHEEDFMIKSVETQLPLGVSFAMHIRKEDEL